MDNAQKLELELELEFAFESKQGFAIELKIGPFMTLLKSLSLCSPILAFQLRCRCFVYFTFLAKIAAELPTCPDFQQFEGNRSISQTLQGRGEKLHF